MPYHKKKFILSYEYLTSQFLANNSSTDSGTVTTGRRRYNCASDQ